MVPIGISTDQKRACLGRFWGKADIFASGLKWRD
jgi:hypothetical protein